MAGKATPDDLFASYLKALDAHGYSFQYTVLKMVAELFDAGQSRWVFEVAEFPVEARRQGTRIDFILHCANSHLYLLAECKRANPALANWCFARAPFVRRNDWDRIILQQLLNGPAGSPCAKILTKSPPSGQAIYHLGTEMHTNVKGEAQGKGRGAIEDAATQVCRGLNGMMDCCAEKGGLALPVFFPVIFTTAHLWTSDIDVSEADLATGRLSSREGQLQEVGWLLYQYHQSPGLTHGLFNADNCGSLGDYLYSESARTIAIVGAAGIEGFLSLNWPDILF
jgi:hypothetical protein